MKIPFYQSQWFNVDLVSLAKTLGHSVSDVADARIYREVYKRLLNEGTQVPSIEWIAKKHKLSDWLEDYFRDKKLEKSSILSIGCGLGVVEQPLIEKKFLVDLHECQNVSVRYLKKNYPKEYKKTKLILSYDLKSIRDKSYDTVMAITSTYGLDDETLKSFFENIARVIKKDGTFLFYETVLNFLDFKNKLRKIVFNEKSEGLLWGWKRSRGEFIKIAKKFGFRVESYYCFDNENNIVNYKNSLSRYVCPNLSWEMIVFKSN
jgi:SAM-dependent methyltransferase